MKVLELLVDTFVSPFLKFKGSVPPTLRGIPDLPQALGYTKGFFY